MVEDPNFLNPLLNPIFNEVLIRFFWLFVAGLALIFILNKFSFRELWDKELGKRYLSWLVIGSIFLAFVFVGGIPSLFFLLIIMVLALYEIKKMAKLSNGYFIILSILAFISITVASYFEGNFYILPILYFTILTTFTVRLNDPKKFSSLAVSLYSSIWIIFLLCHFILLGHLNNGLDNTKALLLLIGFAVPLADIGAYVFGKMFSKINFLNKYKIASNISPHKIWAGVLGDIIGAAIGIWIMSFVIGNYFSFTQMAILACLIGVFSVIGDMNESLLKRYFNVKDSSNLIPGHGGILDRIDSIMRVIVVVYYFCLLVL